MEAVAPLPSKKTSVQKKIPSPLKLQLQQSPESLRPEGSLSKISSHDDLALKLEKCSIQTPLMEGYGCKDVRKSRTFEPFRRRYFVLYNEILIYYQHKAQFERDKKKGLKCATAIILEDVYLTKPEVRHSTMDKISFYLHTSHTLNKREKMLMAVQCRSARHSWIRQLQAQNPSLLSPCQQAPPPCHNVHCHPTHDSPKSIELCTHQCPQVTTLLPQFTQSDVTFFCIIYFS